jgi:hypothetical protein
MKENWKKNNLDLDFDVAVSFCFAICPFNYVFEFGFCQLFHILKIAQYIHRIFLIRNENFRILQPE